MVCIIKITPKNHSPKKVASLLDDLDLPLIELNHNFVLRYIQLYTGHVQNDI